MDNNFVISDVYTPDYFFSYIYDSKNTQFISIRRGVLKSNNYIYHCFNYSGSESNMKIIPQILIDKNNRGFLICYYC